MAGKFKGNYKGGNRRKKQKYTPIEKFAYQYGLVSRGLKNPDSLISESFNRGKTEKSKKPKKSIF